ncbi:MAG TPA: class I SAM-dependent methyltransferase [Thermoplasmata archaeon]|nr:class I SAM-dependent methyltransferase [Thermoplasmata archaeon]
MSPSDDRPPGPDHYFTERPRSPSRRRELRFLYRGNILTFEVDAGVFASHGLDPGTALLIEALNPRPTDRILDLGCGWGAVGIAAAKLAPRGQVILTDTNHRAIGLARGNVARNGLVNAEVRAGSLFAPVINERFDLIATNPPFHIGRESILELLAQAPDHLTDDGRLLLVGKGSQGIRFYQSWLEDHWGGGVEVRVRGSGYRVLEAMPGTSASDTPTPAVTPKLPGSPELRGAPARRRTPPNRSA